MGAVHWVTPVWGCMWRTEVTTKFREAEFRRTFCTLGTTTIRLSFQKANSGSQMDRIGGRRKWAMKRGERTLVL